MQSARSLFPNLFPVYTRMSIIPTLGRGAFSTSRLALADHGYGSPEPTNPSIKKNQGRSSNSDPTNNGKVDEIKQSKEGMPEPNADSTESTGDKSKPHYKCDPEDQGRSDGAPELVKPEDKK